MDANAAIKSQDGAAHVVATPTGPLLGAQISGADLTKPHSEGEIAAIGAALLKHKVPFFRDQDIGHEDHVHLLDRLKAPQHQMRFRWSPNAIAFWDNRATHHYGVLDYGPHEHVVERVTVMGQEGPAR